MSEPRVTDTLVAFIIDMGTTLQERALAQDLRDCREALSQSEDWREEAHAKAVAMLDKLRADRDYWKREHDAAIAAWRSGSTLADNEVKP
jgi:hypothetical protein